MKAEELEDLKVYSTVLYDDFTRISVLTSILETQVRQTRLCVQSFKDYADEKALKDAGKNH